jgi:hypothetical protein
MLYAYYIALGVTAEGVTHGFVRRFEGPDTICGVYIERDLEIAFVQLFEERDVVGEELLIPAGRLVSRHRTRCHVCAHVYPVQPVPNSRGTSMRCLTLSARNRTVSSVMVPTSQCPGHQQTAVSTPS